MNKLKLLDLFSGIGGFSYGLESTNGFETIAFCEKDKFCQKVLKKHWNDIKIYEDVRNIKGSTIKADVITGGFPCQPFSVAGKQRGTDDDRYLWDETLRVITETKPKWFVGENVDGLVNIQEGKVLQQIQKDLEAESFQVQCVIIPASGIGAWHQRKRVWIIGYSDSNANAKEKQSSNGPENSFSKEHRSKDSSIQFSGGTTNNSLSNSVSIKLDGCSNASRVCETEQQRLDSNEKRNWNEIRSKAERCSEQDLQHPNNQRCEEPNISKEPNGQIIIDRKHDQGRNAETWWQTQSKLCGVPNGISSELDKDRTNRIKSLGNSIVPEIAKEIGLAILEAENE
jgi:DNA (cytosine-5)-methyltransferase 1